MANLLPVNVGMVTDLADKLGLLDGLKRKLKRQPDPAQLSSQRRWRR